MRSARRPAVLLAVLAVFALAASGCGGKSSSGGTVKATEKDFSISLSPTSVNSGKVTFEVSNQGPSTHEFVVFKTDLAPDKLPTTDGGSTVDENGSGVTHVDEIEDVSNGSTQKLAATLESGSYVALCNLPGHYKLGMRAGFTVG